MKSSRQWRALLVLVVILTGSLAEAEGVFAPLNGGEPIDPGLVESAVCLRGGTGTQYLLYLKDGALLARKSDDGGASFTPYVPRLPVSGLTNFRQLTLLTRVFERTVAFFVADGEGGSGLFGLCLGPDGELAPFLDGRLDDLSVGTIGGYSVLPESEDRLLIVYLKADTLKLSRISTGAQMPAVEQADISAAGQPATRFALFERFPPEGTAAVGWYLAAEQEGVAGLYAFDLADGRVVDRTVIDRDLAAGNQQVHFTVTIDDELEVSWANGRQVSTYTRSGGLWRRNGRVTAPLESFACFDLTDGRDHSPALATWPRGGIYTGLAGEEAFLSPVNRNPVLRAPGGLSSSRAGLFLLAYLAEAGGRKAVETRLYDFTAAVWRDLEFPAMADAEILDAWFSGTVRGCYAAVLAEGADGRQVVVHQVSPSAPVFEQLLDVPLAGVPGGEPEGDSVAGELLEEDLLVLTAGRTRIVVDASAARAEVVADDATYSLVSSAETDGESRPVLIRTGRGTLLAIRAR